MRPLCIAFMICCSVVIARPLAAAGPIAPEDFDRLHRLASPAPDESAWATIPWSASLWEARQRAAEEGKPILLWEMDGHPLGCT